MVESAGWQLSLQLIRMWYGLNEHVYLLHHTWPFVTSSYPSAC
jgi:hypothetical protein